MCMCLLLPATSCRTITGHRCKFTASITPRESLRYGVVQVYLHTQLVAQLYAMTAKDPCPEAVRVAENVRERRGGGCKTDRGPEGRGGRRGGACPEAVHM